MGGSAVALLAHEIHSAERTFAHHEEPDRGRGVRNASSIAEAAVAAAKTQTVRLPGEEVAAALVAELAQGVISLDERIQSTDADIEGRFRRHPFAEVITSMPGIGFRLGAEFLAAVGDPTLIGSADQLAAWAGLAPVPRDSGKRTGRLHTPQRHSRRLRRVMYMSALTAIRCDPQSRAYYQRKRDEGKRPIQATIGQVQGRGVRRLRVILRGDGSGGQCRRYGLLFCW